MPAVPWLTFSAPGLVEFRARLAAAQAALGPMVGQALFDTAVSVQQQLGDEAPYGYQAVEPSAPPGNDAEGKLFESFRSQWQQDGTTYWAYVYTVQPTKLTFVRYGTGIYGPYGQRIYPRTARALRWVDIHGTHFARSIAGMPANDFVTPVVQGGMVQAAAALTLAIEEIMQAALGGA